MFIVIWLVVSLYHDLIDLANELFEIGSIAGIFHGPVTLTWTASVQFLPSPTDETCLCCSAMSGLMKLACLLSPATVFHYTTV